MSVILKSIFIIAHVFERTISSSFASLQSMCTFAMEPKLEILIVFLPVRVKDLSPFTEISGTKINTNPTKSTRKLHATSKSWNGWISWLTPAAIQPKFDKCHAVSANWKLRKIQPDTALTCLLRDTLQEYTILPPTHKRNRSHIMWTSMNTDHRALTMLL